MARIMQSGRVVDARQRCCGRWSNCAPLPGWTVRTPTSDGELAIMRRVHVSWAICASFVFPRQGMPDLCKVSQRRFRGDQLVRSLSEACYPRIPNQGEHRFRRPGKTGRRAIGTSGRHAPEQVDGIHRNRWPAWAGLCSSRASHACSDSVCNGRWTVKTSIEGPRRWAMDGVDSSQEDTNCPHRPQPLLRQPSPGQSGPVFDDQMVLFSTIKVCAKWPEWPCFR
jgi:hypothetical protein